MTPPARHQAAIGILDRFLAGEAAEKALTSWARENRYAGAKDRAAVRDLVFAALRSLRSHAALGGAMTGRGLILGGLRARGEDPGGVFTGLGHAPAPLSEAERKAGRAPVGNEALDCPDWLAPALRESLGDGFEPILRAFQHRAPVFLRVNLAKATREAAGKRLEEESVGTRPHPLSPSALEVLSGARRIAAGEAYREGWVDLQDAASQAVADALPLKPGMAALDCCAGGGGKVLALAARVPGAQLAAHDADPARMRDLPLRAARAGARVDILADPKARAPYDLVLCDAPCSGSGAWRRSPEGKWRLTPERLAELIALQAEILNAAAALVREGGILAYATCSLLRAENTAQTEAFLRPGWEPILEKQWTPGDGGDGFYLSLMRRVGRG